ncbi:MAG TPA: tRNA (adenosine(37)-N6)-threonylcarbamoyltransferase complex ATPase subunit type 1 TsaE [Candidatus Azoamicus sp. OHIO2]
MFIYLINKKYLLKLGYILSKTIKTDLTFFLIGNIGIGKTLLSKSIIGCYMRYKNIIKSPTYNVITSYFYKNIWFHHIDFFRITNITDMFNIDLYDYLNKNSTVFIECYDQHKIFFLKKNISIYFFYINNLNTRCLLINSNVYTITKLLI